MTPASISSRHLQPATDNFKSSLKVLTIKGKKITNQPIQKKKTRILSIDGGGIRGIIPATILVYLENQLQEKSGNPKACVSDYFDFIAGTSTGGILACTYLLPDPNEPNKSRYSAQEVLNMYLQKKGCGIFKQSLFRKWSSLMGLRKEKYSTTNLENALQKCLGKQTRFDELVKPCLVTTYDIQQRKTRLFKSYDEDASHYPVWKVSKATASAPTFFQPAVFTSKKGKEEVLVDGGLYAVNPAMYAFTEAKNNTFSKLSNQSQRTETSRQTDMIIVSLGTGTLQTSYSVDQVKSGGAMAWMRPMIDILLSAGSESVDEQLTQLLNQKTANNTKSYYRINPKLSTGNDRLDDISANNLHALHQTGLEYIRNYKTELDQIVDQLITNQ